MEKCFGGGLPAKDRHARLTYMKLRHHIGELTLTDCKDYFEHYSTLTSCFDDLRPFLCHLPFEALEEFWDFTLARSASMQVKKPVRLFLIL
jgi:N-terminal acetyltransferase B complex non-catalytic subunit